MKFSVQELLKHIQEPIEISETLDVKKDLQARYPEILDITPVVVSGLLIPSKSDTVAHLQIQATLTLPSSRSLEPVELAMDFTIDEVYLTHAQAQMTDTLTDEVIIVEGQTIDLVEAVEDYLLLAIPTQILTPEEIAGKNLLKGEFWEVLTEDEYEIRQAEKDQQIDPRLAKLKNLLED